MEEDRPKIGVGVIILKDGKVLIGKRKSSHGEGTWLFPSGHLEFGESIEKCAKRETLEECGVKIKNIISGPFTNDIFMEQKKHYITLFVVCDYNGGEPKTLEPNKLDSWEWISWEEIPKPLFLPIENLIKTGFNPWTYKKNYLQTKQ